MSHDFLNDLKEGKPEAFERLLEDHEATVYRFFLLSHGDSALARDQCCETFGNLVFAIPKMRGGATSLRAFIIGVAKNVLRRGWRSGDTRTVALSEVDLAGVVDEAPTPFERVAAKEKVVRLLEAIGEMEEPGRQILILRFVEGLKIREIAEAMELPINTVKSHLHRARKNLIQTFENDFFESEKTG